MLALSACISAGNEPINDVSNYQTLIPGQTTKLEVYKTFGQPFDVTYQGEASCWVYYTTSMSMNAGTLIPVYGLFAGGNDITARISRFWFGDEGAFLRNEYRTETVLLNSWATYGAPSASHEELTRVQTEMAKLGLEFDAQKARTDGNDVYMFRLGKSVPPSPSANINAAPDTCGF